MIRGFGGAQTIECVRLDDVDGVRLITFDRPASLNALNRQLAAAITAALRVADLDPAVDAIVLTGGGRAFSAGADLEEASRLGIADVEPWFRVMADCYRQIVLVDKPVIAAVNGVAAGGGYQIALMADWRVGHSGTRMAQPEIDAGLPSIMGSYLMTLHLPRSLNQELSYTGRTMDAEECRRVGLLNDLAEPDELIPRALARARELAGKPRMAFRATKARFRDLALRGFDEAYRAVVSGMEASYASGEPQVIMARFLERRRKT
ncbi:MAG TPA: enoyl-CoA hydratase/isomerase family protein [Candidatus Binatia bacterium]|nr:enoyl-CoA hydratase/isomerase family protein [Candidatus Binatia bacterium]